MRAWFAAGASVVGEAHIVRDRPNDDAFSIKQQGQWTAIVLSDGAGSSVRAREGSSLVSELFVLELISIGTQLDEFGPGPWLNDAVIKAVLNVRAALASLAGSYDLKDLHCTLVAVLISTEGGFTVHIGDGAIIVGRAYEKNSIEIEVHSYPENGEYANETFFITESTWLKNIKIKPLGNVEWIVLTTDGAASILMDKAVNASALQAFFQLISRNSKVQALSDLILKYLKSDYAKSCSSDDKTLAIAYREEVTALEFSIEAEQTGEAPERLPETQSSGQSEIYNLIKKNKKLPDAHCQPRNKNIFLNLSEPTAGVLALVFLVLTLNMASGFLGFYLGKPVEHGPNLKSSSFNMLEMNDKTDSRR